MPCATPCSILPCSLRCEQDLACGHRCPSVCGELCPSTEFCQQCASTTVKQTPVDIGSLVAIETLTYQEIDLDETPILVLACGHIILMTTMDRLIGIAEHYEVSDSGLPIAFRSKSFPFAVHKGESCPHCQGSLRDLNRYNRLVKRPTLDASTKKFIAHSTAALLPLVTKVQREEKRLTNTKSRISAGKPVAKPRYIPIHPTLVRLGGPRGLLFHNISELSGLDTRCGPLLALRNEILTFWAKVKDDEQPFSEIQRTVAQRPQEMHSAKILQTTSGLLTKALLLRCEFDILSEIIKIHGEHHPGVGMHHHWLTLELCLDLDFSRRDCGDLIKEAIQKSQVITEIEARLLFAKFVALERVASIDPDRIEGLLTQGCQQMKAAKDRAENFPITTILGQPSLSDSDLAIQKLEMFADIEEVEKLLHRSTSSTMMISVKTQSRYLALTRDLEVGKTWCYCVNMHAVLILLQLLRRKLTSMQFTKEEHARMNMVRCPQCGEVGAGPPEEVVEKVSNAVDFDDKVEDKAGDMTYSAQLEQLQQDS